MKRYESVHVLQIPLCCVSTKHCSENALTAGNNLALKSEINENVPLNSVFKQYPLIYHSGALVWLFWCSYKLDVC